MDHLRARQRREGTQVQVRPERQRVPRGRSVQLRLADDDLGAKGRAEDAAPLPDARQASADGRGRHVVERHHHRQPARQAQPRGRPFRKLPHPLLVGEHFRQQALRPRHLVQVEQLGRIAARPHVEERHRGVGFVDGEPPGQVVENPAAAAQGFMGTRQPVGIVLPEPGENPAGQSGEALRAVAPERLGQRTVGLPTLDDRCRARVVPQ